MIKYIALAGAAMAGLAGNASAAVVTTEAAASGKLSAASQQLHTKVVVPFANDVNDAFFRKTASEFSGVGGMIMNTKTLDQEGFVGLCTGSLINPQVVLTAAHCLDDLDLYRVRWRSGSGTIDPGRVNYEASHYWIHPMYDKTRFFEGYDIAAVILETPVTNGETIYDVYDRPFNERFQFMTKVGFGGTGNGATGDTSFDFGKRAGYNTYDFYGDEVFTDINSNGLIYDFDSGDTANDLNGVLGQLLYGTALFEDAGIYYSPSRDEFSFGAPFGPPTGGVQDWRLVEVGTAGGDSGGPGFIDGKIAGITSWGLNDALGDCGTPGGIDVSCNVSSWGDMSGDTRVSAFLTELRALQNFVSVRQTNAEGIVTLQIVPAPSAVVLFGLGAVAMGALRRRRG